MTDFKELVHTTVEAGKLMLKLESKGSQVVDRILSLGWIRLFLLSPSNNRISPTHSMEGNLLYAVKYTDLNVQLI